MARRWIKFLLAFLVLVILLGTVVVLNSNRMLRSETCKVCKGIVELCCKPADYFEKTVITVPKTAQGAIEIDFVPKYIGRHAVMFFGPTDRVHSTPISCISGEREISLNNARSRVVSKDGAGVFLVSTVITKSQLDTKIRCTVTLTYSQSNEDGKLVAMKLSDL